jgi:hypothetical protein
LEHAQAALLEISTTDVDLRHPSGGVIRILEVLMADDLEREYALDADDPSTARTMSSYQRDLLMRGATALVRMIDKTM